MAKTNSGRAKKSETNLTQDTKVGLFGASGRMGREIAELWVQTFHQPIFLAVSKEPGELQFLNHAFDLKNPLCKEVDVWIDFSSPEGTEKILQFCLQQNRPLVSGTTGFSVVQNNKLKKVAQKIPVLWSPNMSLGINILIRALQSLAGVVGFDYQIEEVHHRHKKDKPSGTALFIHRELEKVVNKSVERPLALRGGGVFGIHKVWALSEEETITFEHQALNRKVFAKGAIEAALWLKNKKPGFYSMQDLIGNK